MVSTRNYSPVLSLSFLSLAHLQTAVRHFLQITPPIRRMNSAPSRTSSFSSSLSRFISLAMAFAVIKLSPVTIRTFIPATLHFYIASGTSFRNTSFTPINARQVSSDFSISNTPLSSFVSRSLVGLSFLYAKHKVLNEF